MKELSALQQLKADKETACVAKQMLVWMMAMLKGKRNVGFWWSIPMASMRRWRTVESYGLLDNGNVEVLQVVDRNDDGVFQPRSLRTPIKEAHNNGNNVPHAQGD